MEGQVDAVLLGASFFAIGYTSTCPGSLIVEETEVLGNDFEGCLRASGPDADAASDRDNLDFRRFLRGKGVLSDSGCVDIPSLATVVCAYVREKRIPVLLDAFLLSAEKREDGYHLSIFTNDGIHMIRTRELIDTTALRVSQRDNLVVRAKYLYALCYRPAADFTARLRAVCPACEFSRGFFQDEWIVRFPFDGSAALPTARQAVYDWWRRAFPLGEALIDGMSFDFDVDAVSGTRPDFCRWVPHHRHAGPVEAFTDGCLAAGGKGPESNAVL